MIERLAAGALTALLAIPLVLLVTGPQGHPAVIHATPAVAATIDPTSPIEPPAAVPEAIEEPTTPTPVTAADRPIPSPAVTSTAIPGPQPAPLPVCATPKQAAYAAALAPYPHPDPTCTATWTADDWTLFMNSNPYVGFQCPPDPAGYDPAKNGGLPLPSVCTR